MVKAHVYLLVICIIGMANSAVHFDMTTNFMKVGKNQQPNPGPDMDTVYVPGMCDWVPF